MLTFFRELFSPPRHIILLVIAAWIGLSLAEKRTERHGLTRDQINNLMFYGLSAFIIGGRVSFVLQNLASFIKSPLGIISVNPDIFDPLGAIAAALICAFAYCQRQQISLWSCLDALTPFFAILSIGIGLSHFAAGTAFGTETEAAWGIYLWNATRHPTQIYETLAATLTFVLIWVKKHDPHPGVLFLIFAAVTTGFELIIQAYRADSSFIANGMNESQLMAWGILLVVFVLLELQLKKKIHTSE